MVCVDSIGSGVLSEPSAFKSGLMTILPDFRIATETAVARPKTGMPASTSASEVALIAFDSSSVFYMCRVR